MILDPTDPRLARYRLTIVMQELGYQLDEHIARNALAVRHLFSLEEDVARLALRYGLVDAFDGGMFALTKKGADVVLDYYVEHPAMVVLYERLERGE